MTHTIILGTGSTTELPNAKTVGEAATIAAAENHIKGATFTLKIDGTPTPPSDPIDKIKAGATLELIELPPTPNTPTASPDPKP